MNKTETLAAIKIMTAFCEGREIVWSDTLTCSRFYDDNAPRWNWQRYDYRIKPSKKIVPFTMENCPVGKVVRTKKRDYRGIIQEAGVVTALLPWGRPSYDAMLDFYTMDDGSPCGIEITE